MRTNSSHTQLNKKYVQLEFVYMQVSSKPKKEKKDTFIVGKR